MAKGYPAQIVGDEKKLSRSPVASPSANPKSGQFQIMGDQVKLGKTAVQSPSSNPKGGQYQIVGDQTSLPRNPVKGYAQGGTPMSHRANEQSKTSAGKK